MHKPIKRCFALLMALVLALGIFPTAFAVEAATEPTNDTEPTQATQTSEDIAKPASEPAAAADAAAADSANEDYGITATSSTQGSIMLFDYADNGNYTTVLKSQLTISYRPNGTDGAKTAYIKNLGWHFARYGGVAYADDPLYCIEPYRSYAASTSGNSVDRDVALDGTGNTAGTNVWYALPAARREAIGLILLYSDRMWDDSISVTTTPKDDNPNVPLRIATQFLIYEIVCGLRDPETFVLNAVNECGTAGNVFYNAGVAAVPYFAPNYNQLVSYIQAALTIPSFTSESSSTAPTIALTGEETSVYDSNSVLGNFSFTDGNGAAFYKSGNTLYITQTGTISESTVFKAVRSTPSASNSAYCLWYMTGSAYQTTISLYRASTGTLNAYFKLKAPATGGIDLVKTTEDGKNLSGWRFGIYSDKACTSLVSGPHTTDSNGKISVAGLSAGTYYVKELGHSDSTINTLYSCAGANPQTVTLAAGQVSTVSFRNTLNKGSVKLVKETNTGKNLSGWQIGLYLDAACTEPVENSPFTTGSDGTITVTGLRPGTYYAKEVDTGDPFWEYDTAVKKVTVVIDETAAVTFTNTHYGRISFRKSTNTGNHLGGWTFRVLNSDGNVVGEFTTDENGYACTGNLPLGRYTVVELSVEDSYWNCELGFHDVTVKAGETTMDEWLNKEQGLGWFHKSTNTGESLSGWQITIYTDEACTQAVRTVTTGENGKVGYYLDPGIYYAKETGDTEGRFESEYWLVDETVQKFEIKAHEDVDIRFTNIQYGKLRIVKKVEGEGSVAGWKFKITDSSGKEIEGSPFTSLEDGTITPPNMLPGQYTIEELIPEDSPYYCKSENPRIVTVMQGSAVEVLFTNALRSGKIAVQKVDQTGAPRAGAEFLLEWSEDGESWFPVVYSASVLKGGCSSDGLSDGKLTSGEDGLITFEGLYHDLLYRLTETKAPEGLQLLTDYAFCGKLPDETDYVKELTVVNVPSFSLPMTGSKSRLIMASSLLVCLAACIGAIIYLRKRRW